jgi:hypothetical protein
MLFTILFILCFCVLFWDIKDVVGGTKSPVEGLIIYAPSRPQNC